MPATSLDLVGRRRHRADALAAVARRPGMAILEVDGASIRVRDQGHGSTTVVIVPDPPNVIEHYDELFEKLTPDFRVVAFEAPGFGFSVPQPGFGFTLEEQADVSAAVARGLGITRAVWACPCVGAYVALRVAQRTPDLVGALVCAQAPSWEHELAWAERIDRKGTVRRPWVGQILVRAGKQRVAEGWYRWVAGDLRRREITDIGIESLRDGARFPLASAMQSVFAASDETFEPVHVPATFVWATDDPSHRHTLRESSRALTAESRIAEFEGSGHFPDLDQPDRFAEQVRDAADALR